MLALFAQLFDTTGFVPRWLCGQWTETMGWTHIISDTLIFGAYAAIPACLVFFIRKRNDFPFPPIFWLFALFIFSCGATHLIDATLFWQPWYRLSGLVKVITAVASWATVIALFKVTPSALALPGLALVNQQLTHEMKTRAEAQEALRKSEQQLRLATDAAGLGIWQWEPATDLVTWENEWPTRILGLDSASESVDSKRFAEQFVYAEDRPRFQKAVENAMQDDPRFLFEGRLLRKDGSLRWVVISGSAHTRKESGNRVLIGTARDITDQKNAEAALQTAHDKLETILGSISDGLAVLDKDWCYTYFNQQGADMLGVEREALLGKSVWDLFPKTEGTLFHEKYHQAVNSGQPQHFREYYPEPLNTWLECHCYPSSEGLSVYFRNVTAEVQAEEVLRHNAALFSTLVDAAPLGVYVVDDDLRIQQVNPLALPVLTNAQPLIGRKFVEVMTILWGEKVGKEIDDIFNHTLQTGEPYRTPQFVHARHDVAGEQAYEWEAVRVILANGKYAVVCYFKDVTERRRIEQSLIAGRESLRKRTEELETLFDTVPACVWITTDAQCAVVIGNRAANQLTGTAPGSNVSQTAAAEGKAIYLRQLREDGTEYLPEELPLQRAVATAQPVRDEVLQFHFSDGRQIQVLGNAVPLFDEESKVRGAIAAFHDITALKKAEAELIEARKAAEEANQSKDRFLAMISHELRTPLNPALMAISLIETSPGLSQEILDDVALIKRNLKLEVKLIDDLLDVSRLAVGKLVLHKESVDLNSVVREAAEFCQQEITTKNLAFDFQLNAEVGKIYADPTRLRQILWNVMRNAVKFTPPGGQVHISTALLTPSRCEFRCVDSGIGLSAEQLTRIFRAFEQGEASITRRFGGLGAGLAICRALVELHGGTIRAESAGLNSGATFIVELPVSSQ